MKNTWHLLFLCIVFSIYTKAQLVGVYNTTVSISPSYTINNNSTFTVTGQAINSGTNAINGSVYVNLAIDTSSTGTAKYYWRKTVGYPVSNFLPNAIFTFTVGDVGSDTNGYKVNGNGTTVIVWVSANIPEDTLSVADTATTLIHVTPYTLHIKDEFNPESIMVENPASSVIQFKVSGLKFKVSGVELLNTKGDIVLCKELETVNSKDETDFIEIETQHISSGIYYLRFSNKQTLKTITKKIIILH